MKHHGNPRGQFTGIRLFNQEAFLVKRGVVRYSGRASALANDLKCPRAARRIAKLERELLEQIAALEGKVVDHAE